MRDAFRRRSVRVVVAALAALALAQGCRSHDDDDDDGVTLSDDDVGEFLASETIGPAGGVVEVTDSDSPLFGARIDVPAGALAVETTLTIRQLVSGSPWPSDVLAVDFGPDGTTFAVPVTVTVPYAPGFLAANGVTDPSTLHVVLAPAGRAPETLATVASDPIARTISGRTTHFTPGGVPAYTDATLTGDYFVIEHFVDSTAPQSDAPSAGSPLPNPLGLAASFGVLTFDGAGGVSFAGTEKYDQSLASSSWTGTYSVSPDGVLDIDGKETGGVLSGGEMFVVSSSSAPDEVSMRMGLRMGGTFSTASLSGEYFVQEFAVDETISQPTTPPTGSPLPNPLGFTSSYGTLSFDGAGMFSGGWVEKFDQTIAPTTTDGPYSVASDGVISMDGEESGFLLAGGDAYIVATSVADGGVSVQLGIRKAGVFSTASLVGDYSYHSYRIDQAAPQGTTPPAGTPLPAPLGFVADYGLASLDGAGGYGFSGTRKADSSLAPLAFAGTYSIDAAGYLTLDSGTAGYVLAGGRAACFVNATAPSDIRFGIMILRR